MTFRFTLGALDIYPSHLEYNYPSSKFSPHKFVVSANKRNLSMYISLSESHPEIVKKYDLYEPHIVGGGSFYSNLLDVLTIGRFSNTYWAIPREIGQSFMQLIVPELKNNGLQFLEAMTLTKEEYINHYWEKHGYVRKEANPCESLLWVKAMQTREEGY